MLCDNNPGPFIPGPKIVRVNDIAPQQKSGANNADDKNDPAQQAEAHRFPVGLVFEDLRRGGGHEDDVLINGGGGAFVWLFIKRRPFKLYLL